jgi:GH18 family chitinase
MRKTLQTTLLFFVGMSAAMSQKIVGYLPEYQWSTYGSNVQFDKLTDVNYAFMNPTTTGELSSDGTNVFGFDYNIFDQVKTRCVQNNVRFHLAVGGADPNGSRKQRLFNVCSNSTTRANFVNKLVAFAKTNKLAGLDIDWEFPTTTTEIAAHKSFISELRTKINSDYPGCILSIAVGGEYLTNPSHLQYIDASVFPLVDIVYIMAYDFPVYHTGAGAQHSSLTNAQGSMEAWNTKGVPYSKMILGVPFYGKSSDRTGVDQLYSVLSASNPATAFTADNMNYGGKTYYYNGKPTLESKVTMALGKGSQGIMIWDVAQDRKDQYSLLSVLKTKVDATCPVAQPNLGLDQSICKAGDTRVLDCGVDPTSTVTAKWYKDGTIINNATGRTYTASAAGQYKVVLSSGSCSKESVMNLSIGSSVTTQGASRCGTGDVTVSVATPATGSFSWWTAAVGGTQLGTGRSYLAPNLATTDTFYVQEVAANQKNFGLGRTDLIDNANNYAWQTKFGQFAQVITVNQNLSILSVKAFLLSGAAGQVVKVTVYNQDGQNIVAQGAAQTLSVTSSFFSPTVISAGINLSPGTYYLAIEGSVPNYATGSKANTIAMQTAPADQAVYSALDGTTTVMTMKGNAIQRFSATGYIDQPSPAGGQSGFYGQIFDVQIQTGTAASNCGRALAIATITSGATTSLGVDAQTKTVCVGNDGLVTVKSSEYGISYQAYIGTTAYGLPVSGTGSNITLTLPAADLTTFAGSNNFANVSVQATKAGCGPSTLSDTAGIRLSAKPNSALLASGSSVCSSVNSATVTVAGTKTGESYQAILGTASVGQLVTSTGGTVTLNVPVSSLASGWNTINVSASISGCSVVNLTDTARVRLSTLPSAALTVTGSRVCSNTNNATVTIAGTKTGESYQAFLGNTSAGTSVSSTGGNVSLSIPVSSLSAGWNTLSVRASIVGCSTVNLADTAAVSLSSAPVAPGTITGSASVIDNQSNVSYSVTPVANATSYVWTYTPSTGVTLNGTSNSITASFVSGAASGNLTVKASNSCGTSSASPARTISVTKATGVEELWLTYGLSVSPNPSASDFTLRINQISPVSLVVYNTIGEPVEVLSSLNDQLSFGNNLVPGVYMVKATIAGKNASFKIVKQ